MKALVIGGTGPTGPYIVEGLLRREYEVTIYHRGTHEFEIPPSVKHIHGDPFSSDLERDLGGLRFDVVISNYGRLRNNAQLMAGKCDRFIGITGGSGYLGWSNPTHNPKRSVDIPCSEDAPMYSDLNQDHFGTRVAQGEKVVMEKHVQNLFKATILRYPFVYGPRQPRPIIWPLVQRILDGRKHIIVPGDGLQLLARGYTENCAHALLTAIDNPRAIGETYNVADEKCFSLYDFIRLIVESMGAVVELVPISHPRAFEVTRGYGIPSFHRMFDMAKSIYQLGYRDVVPTPEAVKRSVEWSLANRSAVANQAEVLDDPYAYELEDELIGAWKRHVQQLSDTLPPVPSQKPRKYEYGGNATHVA
jgi:nucleoside-diphosphate-sugar epimerase